MSTYRKLELKPTTPTPAKPVLKTNPLKPAPKPVMPNIAKRKELAEKAAIVSSGAVITTPPVEKAVFKICQKEESPNFGRPMWIISSPAGGIDFFMWADGKDFQGQPDPTIVVEEGVLISEPPKIAPKQKFTKKDFAAGQTGAFKEIQDKMDEKLSFMKDSFDVLTKKIEEIQEENKKMKVLMMQVLKKVSSEDEAEEVDDDQDFLEDSEEVEPPKKKAKIRE